MAKVKIDVTANDKASGKLKGLTKSIIGAQLVTQGLQAATRKLMAVGKEAIETFKKQEMAEARLSAAVGGNIDDFKAFASELQQITTVGDETTLELLQLANSMGVSQDNMKQAAKDAISLSKALGIEVTSAMKLAVNAQNDQFGALARYLPELRAATTEEEKRAIVQNALANGFKIATSEVETFSGKIQQLENSKGDLYETAGRLIGAIGIGFVDSMKDSVEGMNDFISNADNMAESMGNLAAAGETGVVLFEEWVTNLQQLGSSILNAFKPISEAADDTRELSGVFMVFEAALATTRSAADYVSYGIEVVSINFRTLIGVVKEVSAGLSAFFDAIKDKNFKGINDAIKETQSNIVGILKESTKEQIGLSKDFIKQQIKDSADLEKNAKALQDRILGKRKEVIDRTIVALQQLNDKAKESGQQVVGGMVNGVPLILQSFEEIKAGMADVIAQQEAAAKKMKQQWGAAAMSFISSLGNAFSTVANAAQAFYANRVTDVQNALTEDLAAIDKTTEARLASLGLIEQTMSEKLTTELAALKEKLNEESDEETQAQLQKTINEKQNELTRTKIVETAETQKTTAKKEALKKQSKLEESAFNAKKGTDIANVWISAGLGVMQAWSQAMGIPFPGNVIVGTAMSALITAMAGVQTGAISGQSYKKPQGLAVGSESASGGMTLVGERGPEIVNIPGGSQVVESGVTEQLTGGGGLGSMYIEKLVVMANNAGELINELTEIQRFEGARI
jgi:hypothetical protein